MSEVMYFQHVCKFYIIIDDLLDFLILMVPIRFGSATGNCTMTYKDIQSALQIVEIRPPISCGGGHQQKAYIRCSES